MEPLLICRDSHLLLVDAILYIYSGFILLAIVRCGIDGFLYSEEVSASILCHHKVIIDDMVSKLRNDLDDFRQEKVDDLSCSCAVSMRVIYQSFRMFRDCAFREPHVVFPGSLITE